MRCYSREVHKIAILDIRMMNTDRNVSPCWVWPKRSIVFVAQDANILVKRMRVRPQPVSTAPGVPDSVSPPAAHPHAPGAVKSDPSTHGDSPSSPLTSPNISPFIFAQSPAHSAANSGPNGFGNAQQHHRAASSSV